MDVQLNDDPPYLEKLGLNLMVIRLSPVIDASFVNPLIDASRCEFPKNIYFIILIKNRTKFFLQSAFPNNFHLYESPFAFPQDNLII